jgi:hypothetical protein
MMTPAGRPCRVITISSDAARRKYLDRSSLTFANATVVERARFVEPLLRFGLRDDGEDFDRTLGNVIEHPNVIHAQTVLGLTEAPEPLDAASTGLRWLESKVALQRIPNG